MSSDKIFKIVIMQEDSAIREHYLYAGSKGEALRLAVQRKVKKYGETIINVEKVDDRT